MIFSRYLIPTVVVSDNGPQFTSYEHTQKKSEEWDFKHAASSPRYLKSNGFVETNYRLFRKHYQNLYKLETSPK